MSPFNTVHYSQVHWHEGLFLQPHHFQILEKGVTDRFGTERKLHFPYAYGLIEAEYSEEDLRNGQLRLKRLRALMPGGLDVSVPGNAELPSLDLKSLAVDGASKITVYLAVPEWFEDRANAFIAGQPQDFREKRLYRLREVEVRDENTGTTPKQVQLRLLNARLVPQQDDLSDLDKLPLVRLQRDLQNAAGGFRLDPDYVPPCFVIGASTKLRDLLQDFVAQVQATRRDLAATIGGGNLGEHLKTQLTMRLRSLNHFSPRFAALLGTRQLTPFTFYLEMCALLGELAALQPERDQYFLPPAYNHDDPFPGFRELNDKIRELIRPTDTRVRQIKFEGPPGLLQAQLSPQDFAETSAWYLGVNTKLDRTDLSLFVLNKDAFKVFPKSLAESGAAVLGIELEEQSATPLQLPPIGYYYFRLATGSNPRRWKQIQDESAICLVWANPPAGFDGTTFTLFLVLR